MVARDIAALGEPLELRDYRKEQLDDILRRFIRKSQRRCEETNVLLHALHCKGMYAFNTSFSRPFNYSLPRLGFAK